MPPRTVRALPPSLGSLSWSCRSAGFLMDGRRLQTASGGATTTFAPSSSRRTQGAGLLPLGAGNQTCMEK
eukprot:11851405-Heterocapsa_arctica.AAC.1